MSKTIHIRWEKYHTVDRLRLQYSPTFTKRKISSGEKHLNIFLMVLSIIWKYSLCWYYPLGVWLQCVLFSTVAGNESNYLSWELLHIFNTVCPKSHGAQHRATTLWNYEAVKHVTFTPRFLFGDHSLKYRQFSFEASIISYKIELHFSWTLYGN